MSNISDNDEYWERLAKTIVAANKPVNGHLEDLRDRMTQVEQHVASISQEHASDAKHRSEMMQENQAHGGAKREWWQIVVAIAAVLIALSFGALSSVWIVIQIIKTLAK